MFARCSLPLARSRMNSAAAAAAYRVNNSIRLRGSGALPSRLETWILTFLPLEDVAQLLFASKGCRALVKAHSQSLRAIVVNQWPSDWSAELRKLFVLLRSQASGTVRALEFVSLPVDEDPLHDVVPTLIRNNSSCLEAVRCSNTLHSACLWTGGNTQRQCGRA